MTAPKSTRDRVLAQAKAVINGDRQQDYGEASASFGTIAQLWSTILGAEVTSLDVARCLIAMKISRSLTSPEKLDTWVDIAGYSALAAEIAGAQGPATATLDVPRLPPLGGGIVTNSEA